VKPGGGVVCALLWWAGCHPLPPSAPRDAGLAELTGVTLERMEKDHVTLHLSAPSGQLALDGERLTLLHPHGTAQQQPDGGLIYLTADRLDARLAQGSAVALHATARDAQGRTLATERVTLQGDGGPLLGEAPVTLRGPNFQAVAQGGARVDLTTEEVELLGPVTAGTWRGDGGPRGETAP